MLFKRCSLGLAGLVFIAAGPAHASVGRDDALLWFNIGYAMGTAAYTGDQIDGGALTLGFEKLDWAKPLSIGFSVGYGEITDETTVGNRTSNTTLATVPIYITGKYWLGEGRIQGYAGLGLGIYFSEARTTVTTTGNEYSSAGYAGGGLGVPLGVTLGLGDTVFVQVGYALNWMWSNDAFENDLLHVVNGGVGFNLGK